MTNLSKPSPDRRIRGAVTKNDLLVEPRVFVVRVWRCTDPFRATAREVHRDETAVFDEPHALLRFLTDEVPGEPGLSAAVPGGPADR